MDDLPSSNQHGVLENPPFMDDFPIETSIYIGFSKLAMFDTDSGADSEAALQDCGEGPLPSGIVCYEGQLLVETFKVKVTNSDGTTGSLDMQAGQTG